MSFPTAGLSYSSISVCDKELGRREGVVEARLGGSGFAYFADLADLADLEDFELLLEFLRRNEEPSTVDCICTGT